MAQANNLDFNIVAHTKGMEQIALLINRVSALEAETKKLATANASLAGSTDTVIRNGTRYNNALDAQSKQLRNHRQGVQQLGMQFNDFATSVSTGASPLQAFSQQIGQVGYAMSMMKGRAAAVGAFIAGPWGAAILLGVGVISTLWDMMSSGDEASKGFKQATENASDALFDYQVNIAKTRGELIKLYETQLAGKEMKWREAATDVGRYGGAVQRADQLIKDSFTGKRLPDWLTAGAAVEKFMNQSKFDKAREDERNFYADMLRSQTALNKLKQGFAKEDERAANAAAKKAQSAAAKAQREAEKLAERQSKIAEETSIRDAKSKIFWAEYWVDRQDEISKGEIDAAAQRAKEIGYISEEVGQKIADDVDAPIKAVQESFAAIGNSVSDAFKGMLTGAMSWKDGMRSIISSVIDELWRLYVVQQIVGMVTSFLGGTTGATAARLAPSATATIAANAPLFANGTVNAPGGMAWVGERGPELVNLPRGSQVIPAHRAQSMGGGGINISVDARGSSDPAAVRAQVEAGILQAAPAIIAAAEARTVQGLRRPRLGGAIK